jgi:hypothetical protein
MTEKAKGGLAEPNRVTRFIESYEPGLPLAEAEVNGLVIQNVSLLGRTSLNNRVYSEQAMQDAVRLYDGAPVYIDHPTDDELDARGGIRSVHDFAGRVRNPRKVGDRVRGDIEVLDREPTRSLMLSVAKQMPEQAGMSHRARGELTRTDDGKDRVDSLLSVEAVEFVMEPATVAGLFEAVTRTGEAAAQGSDQDNQAVLRDKVRAAFPKYGEHLWVEATYSEDGVLVFCVMDGPQEGSWRVTYEEQEDGSVTFGTPEKVRRVTVFEPTESRSAGGTNTQEGTMELKDLTLDQLRAGRPDLVASFTEAAKAELAKTDETKTLTATVATLEAERDALKAANAALTAKVDEANVREAQRVREDLIETKLAAAKLPDAAVTDLFRKTLTEAADEAAIDAAIAERKTLVESVAKPAGAGSGNGTPKQPASARITEALGDAEGKKSVTDTDVREAHGSLFG